MQNVDNVIRYYIGNVFHKIIGDSLEVVSKGRTVKDDGIFLLMLSDAFKNFLKQMVKMNSGSPTSFTVGKSFPFIYNGSRMYLY